MQESSGPVHSVSDRESISSGIGVQMIIARDLQGDPDGTATTSEIAREEIEEGRTMVLERGLFNQAARIHNQETREQGHPSQAVSTVHGGSSVDEEGNLVYKQPQVYTIPDSTRSARTRYRS